MLENVNLLAEAEEMIQGLGDPDPGWADAMQKVLRKQSRGSTVVLCKVKIEPEITPESKAEAKERQKRRKLKRKREEMAHAKPEALEKDYEMNLRKIATKGVVTFFRMAQKTQNEVERAQKRTKTTGQREKVVDSVTKKGFLDMLEGGVATTYKETPAEDEPSWKVLRDDFIPKVGMQDWDKEDDDDSD